MQSNTQDILYPLVEKKRQNLIPSLKKIKARLYSQKSKLLSQASRHTLINFVLKTMSSYSMSTFKFQTSFYEEVGFLMKKFWQKGNTQSQNSQHFFTPINWDAIYKSKLEEGLGFDKIKDFNKAILSKASQELIIQLNKLQVQFFSQNILKTIISLILLKNQNDLNICKCLLWTQKLLQ